jgi:MATE family multidrug resistance protein
MNSTSSIARAAIPLYLSQVTASLASLVDTAALGHRGAVSLAAFVVALGVYSPVVAAASGVLRGIMPFVARRESDADLAGIVRNGLWLSVGVGGAGAAVIVFTPEVCRALGVPRATVASMEYLPLALAGAAFCVAVGSLATSVLLGLGNRGAVMVSALAGTGVAVVLSPVLVLGVGPIPSFGVEGTGTALFASAAVNAAIAHAALRRSAPAAYRGLLRSAPEPAALLEPTRVGLPLAGTVLIKFFSLGVLAMAAARISVTSAAVHGVSIALANFLFVAGTSVGQAIVPMAAVADRAGTGTVIRRCTSTGIGLALGAIVGFGLVLVLVQRPAMSLLTSDPVIGQLVAHRLPLILLVVATDTVQVVIGFSLIGMKRTPASLVSFAIAYGALTACAIPVSTAYGLTGLWSAIVVANVVLIAVQGYSLMRNSRRHVPDGRFESRSATRQPVG